MAPVEAVSIVGGMNKHGHKLITRASEIRASVSEAVRAVASDPKHQAAATGAAGGAFVVGTGGAVTGLVGGGVIGAVFGIVPAIFTFGLSIPVGAIIGGGAGLCVGTATGSTIGMVSGGVAGLSAHKNKDGLQEMISNLKWVSANPKMALMRLKNATLSATASARKNVASRVTIAVATAQRVTTTAVTKSVAVAKKRSAELDGFVRSAACDPKIQTTTVGAAGGAAALGASGAATGLVSGGMIGGAVGLVPALFTFGLSIPIGASIGACTGLCVGTVVGSTTGLVAGGVVGFGVYTNKDGIKATAGNALAKARSVSDLAKKSTKDAFAKATVVPTRLFSAVGKGTKVA